MSTRMYLLVVHFDTAMNYIVIMGHHEYVQVFQRRFLGLHHLMLDGMYLWGVRAER